MKKRPERKVLDAIDLLVEQSLLKRKDDYRKPFSETCELCGYEWHGRPNGIECPGAFATDQQADEWHEKVGDARQLLVLEDGSILFHGPVFELWQSVLKRGKCLLPGSMRSGHARKR